MMPDTQALGARLPVLGLIAAELRMGVRAPGVRLLAAAAALAGWSVGGGAGRGSGASAYAAGEAAWQWLGLVTILWFSLTAVRDHAARTTAIFWSKPQPTERIVLARFTGTLGLALLVLVALFVGAAASHLRAAGSLAGFGAFGLQYLRAAWVLAFAGALAYALAMLANSAIAGALAALYWVLTLAGRDYLAKVYFAAYTQNAVTYLLLAGALVCLTALFHQRRRRGAAPAALWASVGLPLLLLGFGLSLRHSLLTEHDPMVRTSQVLDTIQRQTLSLRERSPGFTLPGQGGAPVSLSDYPGKVLLVALWSPASPDAGLVLTRLADVQARYGAQGVQPVAVCISEDQGAATTFAMGHGTAYPIVSDWGAHFAAKPADMSPVAAAHELTDFPTIVVTDRRRRTREVLSGTEALDPDRLARSVEARLQEEPR